MVGTSLRLIEGAQALGTCARFRPPMAPRHKQLRALSHAPLHATTLASGPAALRGARGPAQRPPAHSLGTVPLAASSNKSNATRMRCRSAWSGPSAPAAAASPPSIPLPPSRSGEGRPGAWLGLPSNAIFAARKQPERADSNARTPNKRFERKFSWTRIRTQSGRSSGKRQPTEPRRGQRLHPQWPACPRRRRGASRLARRRSSPAPPPRRPPPPWEPLRRVAL